MTPVKQQAELGVRAKPALVLSIGEKVAGQNHPRKLDHFRPKPGAFSDRFHEVFGDTPTEIRICPPSNNFGDMLDIRWKAFAGGGPSNPDGGYLKALGRTNFAEAGLRGRPEAINGPDVCDGWNLDGTSGAFDMVGPGDDHVAKLGMKVYTVVRFLVPEVLGVGAWAEISSTSAQTRDQLFQTLGRIYRQTSGQWFGIDLILYMQAAKARPVVDGKRITSKFWSLAIRSPYSIAELIAARDSLASIQAPSGLPALDHGNVERDLEISPALWGPPAQPGDDIRQTIASLPPAKDEPLRTRDEPSSVERPADDVLNRIAALRQEVGVDAADLLLTGAFGVEVEQLTAKTAGAYLAGLERIAEQSAEPVVGEIVIGPDGIEEER